MHIASASSVLDEEYPQPETRKKQTSNVKEMQVHRETRQRVPPAKPRIGTRQSPIKSTLWLKADAMETGRGNRANSNR